MNTLKFLSFLAGLNILIFCAPHQNTAFAGLLLEQDQNVETYYKKDKKPRSQADVSLRKDPASADEFILLVEGEGQYAGFTDVRWNSTARIVEHNNAVTVRNSSIKVFSGEKLVFQADKNYDYDKKMATVTHTGENGTAILEEQFPIKGPICDNVTLVHVIDKMLPPAGEPGPQRFYLLTDEPKLYHVMVKNRGTEVLRLPSGEFETTKIQLMADLGPLTDIAARMVPKTYMWLSKDNGWVQYEGMETGYQSPNIISFVTMDNKLD